MINLIIDNEKYLLPTNINEISYSLGIEVEKVISEFENKITLECKKWILSILLSCDYSVVDLIDDNQISTIIDNHIVLNCTYNSINKYIKIQNKIYELIDFDSQSVEQFSNLDINLSDIFYQKEELVKNLYIPAKLNPFKKLYYRLILKNNKTINSINYFLVKAVIRAYIRHKNQLLDDYGMKEVELPKDQIDMDYKPSKLECFGFYNILMSVSDNDLFKMKQYLTIDIKEFFKYLNYLKVKNIEANK